MYSPVALLFIIRSFQIERGQLGGMPEFTAQPSGGVVSEAQ